MRESLFLRLLPYEDKAAALAEAIAAVREGRTPNPVVHPVDPASFCQVPGSPFAYWVSERIRRLFTELPPFESEGRTVKQGLATADDFRFVRAWWEVAPERILDGANGPDWRLVPGPLSLVQGERTKDKGQRTDDLAAFQAWCRQRTFEGKRWVPFAKGGAYSPYYADLHLVVNWERDGEEIKTRVNSESGRPYSNVWQLRGTERDFFFRPGLTWPRRTNGLSFRVVSTGCVFGDKGPMAFVPHDSWMTLLTLAAVMNSRGFYLFVQMLVARVSLAQSFEVGLVQSIPVPNLSESSEKQLRELTQTAINLKYSPDTANETSHVFVLPSLLQVSGDTLARRIEVWTGRVAEAETNLANLQQQIDEIAFQLYGIAEEDQWTMRASLDGRITVEDEEEDKASSEDERAPAADSRNLVADLLGYALGAALGRWDIRYATSSRSHPQLPDPFAPLPACSPGMLTGEDGLPLHEAPPDYPLRIDWDGILTDDPDHSDDIVRRVREVLDLVLCPSSLGLGSSKDNGPRTIDWEQEVCEILGVKELRDYFRKPGNGGFWMDHVKRYSKSRRKAPIYWLLQSSKKNYALWIYYHRLDKDILFKALLNYVEPKIRLEEGRLEPLRAQRAAAGASGKGAKRLEKEIDRQEELISELRDFEDKLRRAANLHLEPDLNDGVVLSIAPLWELVPWKEAKEYWDELLDGKYEWSSISNQLREKGIVRGP